MIRKTPANPGAEHHRYCFGQFILDVDRGTLLKGDSDIPLRPKCFEVLKYLIERHGILVTKDELMKAVWPNLCVTGGSLTQCLIKIRQALGDTRKEVVRTIPRRGYLFDVPVTIYQPDNNADSIAIEGDLVVGQRPSRWSKFVAAMLALAIAAIWWQVESNHLIPVTKGKPVPPLSIAILAFEDLSTEQDLGFFAEGVSEEVLNQLAQTPELHVISRTSSFVFKGQNLGVEEIAGILHVAYILEGSVRREGNRIRVAVQLVNGADSGHLWSQTYDYTLDNVLSVQRDIADLVAIVLTEKLLGGEGGINEIEVSQESQ